MNELALLERKPGGFDHAKPLEQWNLPDCFALLRRRMEAEDPKPGTRSFIRVLRLLERFSLGEVTSGVEYALDIGLSDADSIRSVVEHRADDPVRLFSLEGRPHLAGVRVETTPITACQALLSEVVSRPSINKPTVLELVKGEYLDRRENILLVGPSGTGKTHLATAFGLAALLSGTGSAVLSCDRIGDPAHGGEGGTASAPSTPAACQA